MLVENPERLAAVERSRLLDSKREVVFDELTSAAAHVLDAPFAFMTVVDAERSFWKSTFGIHDGTRQNSVEDSFCRYVIESGGADLIVGDTTADPTTKGNPSIESMNVKAWAGCAVVLDGQTLGTFCVVDERVRDWTEGDRNTLHKLANVASRELQMRVELAEANTTSHQAVAQSVHFSQILDTLRTSLLPPSLPEIPGVDLGAWYEAATDGDLLLGDFYDVFPLPDRRWGFVVGDVCGHGAKAARLTSLIRYTIRSAGVHHNDPGDVLSAVDHAIQADGTNDGQFATVVYLVLDTSTSPHEVTLARAGHPYPVFLRPGSPVQEKTGANGRPIGLGFAAQDFTTERFDFRPGDILVVHTDGLNESRCPGDRTMFGLESLHALVSTVEPGSAQEIVDRIEASVNEFAPERDDDVAVMALVCRSAE